MEIFTVTFLPYDTTIEVNAGQSIIRAAMEAGVHINASCGGDGVCGKCRVLVEQGDVQGGISEYLSTEDRDKGYRLACKSQAAGDVVIRIPVESAIDTSALLRKTPRQTARIHQMDLEDLKKRGLFVPPKEKIYLELPSPTAGDNLPDISRLVNELRLQHGVRRLAIPLPVIRKAPAVFREQDFNVTVTLGHPVRPTGKNRIINVEPGDTTGQHYAVAMDIGTTTIYGQVVDLGTGEVLAEAGKFTARTALSAHRP